VENKGIITAEILTYLQCVEVDLVDHEDYLGHQVPPVSQVERGIQENQECQVKYIN
jgi:hypothetical protein